MSQSAIFHDSMEGNIYVSLDEGKSWKSAEGIPSGKASMFFEHPVDNRYVSSSTFVYQICRLKTWDYRALS